MMPQNAETRQNEQNYVPNIYDVIITQKGERVKKSNKIWQPCYFNKFTTGSYTRRQGGMQAILLLGI